MRGIVEQVEARLPPGSWPVWTGSNHDAGRLVRRWAGGHPERVRCALLMLLTLRGTPVLYYGDEILMPEVDVPSGALRDPLGARTGDPSRGRDGCRSPMQSRAGPGAGFTSPEATPWLPLGDAAACNVAGQREDPGSTLHLVRDLIALRRREPDLRGGRYERLPAPARAWAWRRGDGWAVALNLGEEEAAVPRLAGRVALATDRGRDGELVSGDLVLAPRTGALVRLES